MQNTFSCHLSLSGIQLSVNGILADTVGHFLISENGLAAGQLKFLGFATVNPGHVNRYEMWRQAKGGVSLANL
jgi:hypothetical protein